MSGGRLGGAADNLQLREPNPAHSFCEALLYPSLQLGLPAPHVVDRVGAVLRIDQAMMVPAQEDEIEILVTLGGRERRVGTRASVRMGHDVAMYPRMASSSTSVPGARSLARHEGKAQNIPDLPNSNLRVAIAWTAPHLPPPVGPNVIGGQLIRPNNQT